MPGCLPASVYSLSEIWSVEGTAPGSRLRCRSSSSAVPGGNMASAERSSCKTGGSGAAQSLKSVPGADRARPSIPGDRGAVNLGRLGMVSPTSPMLRWRVSGAAGAGGASSDRRMAAVSTARPEVSTSRMIGAARSSSRNTSVPAGASAKPPGSVVAAWCTACEAAPDAAEL